MNLKHQHSSTLLAKGTALFALMCTTVLVGAQSYRFADSTAEWRILEHGWGVPGPEYFYTESYKVLGDTTINGNSYQLISDGQSYPRHLRRDSANRIYFWSSVYEDLIYDFGAGVGDSITGLSATLGFQATMGCKVTNVDSVDYHGWKKRMYVTCYANTQFDDVWIDGIGSLYNHSIHGGSDQYLTDGPEFSLLCYFEAEQLQYHDTIYGGCTFPYPVTVNELPQEAIHIYPNPASDYVALEFGSNSTDGRLEIISPAGQVVKILPVNSAISTISISDLPEGIYQFQLIDRECQRATSKLVVLRP